jgi:hypothetical protein
MRLIASSPDPPLIPHVDCPGIEIDMGRSGGAYRIVVCDTDG